MKKLKICITGSTGSLGKAIIHSNKNLKFIPYKGDIRSKLKLKEWFQNNKLDCVLHLAAVVPIKEVNRNKKKAMDVNYFGTKNLVDLALKNKISWFFFASTSHVYFSSKKIGAPSPEVGAHRRGFTKGYHDSGFLAVSQSFFNFRG